MYLQHTEGTIGVVTARPTIVRKPVCRVSSGIILCFKFCIVINMYRGVV